MLYVKISTRTVNWKRWEILIPSQGKADVRYTRASNSELAWIQPEIPQLMEYYLRLYKPFGMQCVMCTAGTGKGVCHIKSKFF